MRTIRMKIQALDWTSVDALKWKGSILLGL